MHTRNPQSGGVLAPHTQAGRHMVDHKGAGWKGGSVGLHAARHVVDDLSAEGSGQQ